MVMAAAAPQLAAASAYGWIFAAVWLFYLGENLTALLAPAERLAARRRAWSRWPGSRRCYLCDGPLDAGHRRAGRGHRRVVIRAWLGVAGACWRCSACRCPGAGAHALTCLVYIAAVGDGRACRCSRRCRSRRSLVAAAEAAAGWCRAGRTTATAWRCCSARWPPTGIRLATERQQPAAVAAQQELADLAVQNERARIAADLHDILGHSLTVVTVKAELAQRLLDVDLERARKELRDLEGAGPRRAGRRAGHRDGRARDLAAGRDRRRPGGAGRRERRGRPAGRRRRGAEPQPGAVRLDDPGGGHQHRAAQPGPARRGPARPGQRGDPRRRRRRGTAGARRPGPAPACGGGPRRWARS